MNEEKDIWAITTFYNPIHYQSRLENYRQFRQYLQLQLCTIEHSLNGSYELEENDADILIHITSRDLLWQKERLLNFALTKLPQDAKIIVWLDCDVIFSNKCWYSELRSSLQKSNVVQCYSELVDLNKNADVQDYIGKTIQPNGISVASIVKTNAVHLNSSNLINGEIMRSASPGGAWAANINFLLKYGFYDAMILGGGDRLYVYACLGKIEEAINIAHLDITRADHYRMWAEQIFKVVKGQIGLVEGQLLHLWHGDIKHRHYLLRHQALNKIHFDPTRDIEVDKSGSWKWTVNASENLKQLVTSYFAARSEDGRENAANTTFQIIKDN